MAKLFQGFFNVPPEARSGRDVIVWWEVRRPVYNLILLTCGLFTFLVFLWFWEDFFAEPLGLMVGIPLYIIAANVFYGGGWVAELVLRAISDSFAAKRGRFARYALVAGIGFTVLLTAGPGLATLAARVIVGKGITPQGTFTVMEPDAEDLVGRYSASPDTRELLDDTWGFPDTGAFAVQLQPDGTAILESFPVHLVRETWESEPFDMMADGRALVSDTGRWWLEESKGRGNGSPWNVHTEFRQAHGKQSVASVREGGKPFEEYFIYIRGDGPPYELFVWTEPEQYHYLVFEREEGAQ